MHLIFLSLFCLISSTTADNTTVINSKFPWLRLPPTPQLPLPHKGYRVPINGIMIWYTIYGPADASPLLFLHGGFGNSDYWGLQVQQLQSSYQCILMDSRGQGRSSLSSANITYDLMTSDVIGLLNHLKIKETHVVGWSDGAIIGLNLAMKYPHRLRSLFAFAANYNPSGVKDISLSPVFMAYLARTKIEYEAMNPTKDYDALYTKMINMWSNSPQWTQQNFAKIKLNLPIWIVDGDHEEAIKRQQPDTMTRWITQAGELILPRTSHFAFLQDPRTFTESVMRLLTDKSF